MERSNRRAELEPSEYGMAPKDRKRYNEADFDNVYKPKHYAGKEIEPICYIRATLSDEEFIGYCIGNVIKYISRWREKGGLEDLRKADVYMMWAVKAVENRQMGVASNG